MDKIRVGFIGAGRHATNIVYPSLRYAPLELVAISALEAEETVRAAKTFGAARYYVGGFEEMPEKERNQIDACIVAVSPPAYYRIILSLLDAGLPVYVEKPAAGSVAEATEIEERAQRAGLPVQVGFMKRFAPAYRMAKAAMARVHLSGRQPHSSGRPRALLHGRGRARLGRARRVG